MVIIDLIVVAAEVVSCSQLVHCCSVIWKLSSLIYDDDVNGVKDDCDLKFDEMLSSFNIILGWDSQMIPDSFSS